MLTPFFLVIAQQQYKWDFFRVQPERSVDTWMSFARRGVKPDSLLVQCCARGNATAVSFLLRAW